MGTRTIAALFAAALLTSGCSSDDGAGAGGTDNKNDTSGTIGDAAGDGGAAADAGGTSDSTGASDAAASLDAGATTDTGQPNDTASNATDASKVDCGDLDQKACEMSADCAPRFGADSCQPQSSKTHYAGCMAKGITCGGAMTCASKDGKHYVFNSTCIPKGWKNDGGDIDKCCPTQADPSWFVCDSINDCAVFQGECCDHCNGGKLVAVNKKYLDVAKKVLAKPADQCKGTPCTEKACGQPVAACDNGKCVGKQDPAFPNGCAKLNESDCTISKLCAPLWSYEKTAVCKNTSPLPKTFQGCMKGDMGCGDALTCASKEKELVVFPSTCLPEGWKAEKYELCCKN